MSESYQTFRDVDGDLFFDSNEEIGQRGGIDPRFKIKEIRIDGTPVASPPAASVIFERPNFDARFYTSPSAPN